MPSVATPNDPNAPSQDAGYATPITLSNGGVTPEVLARCGGLHLARALIVRSIAGDDDPRFQVEDSRASEFGLAAEKLGTKRQGRFWAFAGEYNKTLRRLGLNDTLSWPRGSLPAADLATCNRIDVPAA